MSGSVQLKYLMEELDILDFISLTEKASKMSAKQKKELNKK